MEQVAQRLVAYGTEHWRELREPRARQALAAGKVPALAIELRCRAQRDPLVSSEWVAVPLREFQRLVEEAKEQDKCE